MSVYLRIIGLLIAAGAAVLSLPVKPSSSSDDGRLVATAEIVSQKYCPVDEKLFNVVLKLRINFENRTSKALIIGKDVGKFADDQIIAKTKEELALRDYESNPIFDDFGYQDPPDFKPSILLLRSKFVLLEPGKSFETDTTVEPFVWYVSTSGRKGAINDGVHVLQLGFVSWGYTAKYLPFAKAWRKFGQLVTEEIYTEPLDFQIPKNPQIERKCD